MRKVFRLTKGEIKKIFLSPIIFVMSAVLILTLTIAPKFFSPAENETTSTSVSLSGYKVTQIYSSFQNDYKSDYISAYNAVLSDYQKLIDNDKKQSEKLAGKMEGILQAWENFKVGVEACEQAQTDAEKSAANNNCLNLQNKLRDKIVDIEQCYNDIMQGASSPLVLVAKQTDLDIQDNVGRSKSILAYSSAEKNAAYFRNIQTLIEEYNSLNKLKTSLSNVKDLDYSTEDLKANFDAIKQISDQKLPAALEKITRMNSDAATDAEFDANESNQILMKNFIIRYLSACNSATEAMKNSLKISVMERMGDVAISQYVGYENSNFYKFSEAKNKYCYLLENDLSDDDCASMLAFNRNSAQSTNAFDYVYFAMEIVSVIIIAFTVVLGAGMIAKEQSEGTIKLLAIRPYKRWKILISKTLATLFFGFVFMFISVVVALITGIIAYGISFNSMLVIFNATSVFTLPIWVVLLIYLASLMIKIWLYSLLAIAISTIFNSYVASVCIAVGIYLANIVVTFVSKGATWLRYNIFANIDLFKYFGGSFSTSFNSMQNLTNLFASPVFPGTNFGVSLAIIVSLIAILNVAMLTVFNKKDIV